MPAGLYVIVVEPPSLVRLRTGRIGLVSLDATAPVVGGTFALDDAEQHLAMAVDLGALRVGNPVMQAAALALVGTEANSRLTFEARGALGADITGTARAGDVAVPMSVTPAITWAAGDAHSLATAPLRVDLTGWARFEDVRIPLPGMSRVSSVEVRVSSSLSCVPSAQPGGA